METTTKVREDPP